MGLFDIFRKQTPKQQRGIRLLSGEAFNEVLGGGYTSLDSNPEVITACFKIAQLISSMTIYLMRNTEKGDIRVTNELSRKIDIEPNKNMTRSAFMTSLVMNLLLYGDGNSVVFPHTKGGKLDNLEIIAPKRVDFFQVQGRDDYRVAIDDVLYEPSEVLHFTFKPRADYPWLGEGFRASLKPIVENLAQAQATEKAFMSSKWKPSLIIKVDALTDEFSSKDGRKKLLESYVESADIGQPWLIPSEQFAVEQIRPLSLADLRINDSVTLDKKTVASILGVPPYLLGVGEFKADEWNAFINNTIRPIALGIEQEMTRKLILSSKMYLTFNASKLYAYDLRTISTVYGGLFDKGIVLGNEVRDKINLPPLDGLDKLIVLENYIPVEDIGKQKKLGGNEND